MIQRLLRGNALYGFLTLLILFLYSRAVPWSMPQFHAPSHSATTNDSLAMWPKELDAAGLQQLAVRQPRIVLMLLALIVFGVVVGVGGLALTGWGVWTGRIRSLWRFRSHRLPHWSFGELGRVTILTVMIASLMPFVRMAALSRQWWWALDVHVWIATSMTFLDVFVILAILTFATNKGRSTQQIFGFSPRQLLPSILIGLRGYVAIFPWLFLLLCLIMETTTLFHWTPPLEPIHELIFQANRPNVLTMTILLACVVGPIAEEFFFRGLIYSAIRQRTSRIVAMLISGALFALIHTNVVGFLPIMVLGCLLAYLYERTGSLASSITIHILHNTFLISVALVFRQLVV